MPIDGIPLSARSRVYREVADQLRTDPALEAAGVAVIAWDGEGDDVRPTTFDAPTIELFPVLGPQQRVSPDGFRGGMEIQISMFVPSEGRDVRDCLDLWSAVEEALYPSDGDKRRAFRKRLEACGKGGGAEVGEVNLIRPATIGPRFHESNQAFAHFACEGAVSINFLRVLNP